jgi:uncharacterized protein (DUF2252 family)
METPLSIERSVSDYERWLGQHLQLVRPDLKLKRQKIAKSPLAFLRGTFFRWVELWPHTCKELDRAPRVLGVSDLHLENFGTWRDADARLAWGINDFDEVAVVPYTNDLVRLGASALLAIERVSLKISRRQRFPAFLRKWRSGIGPWQC